MRHLAMAAPVLGVVLSCAMSAAAGAYVFYDAPKELAGISKVVLNGDPIPVDDPLAKSTVGIRYKAGNDTLACSGVVIDELHILTAAHCAIGTPDSYTVIFGPSLKSGSPLRVVGSPRVHPEYKRDEVGGFAFDADIAILTLAARIPAGYMPAALSDSVVNEHALATIAGYGRTDGNDSHSSGSLRKGTIEIGSVTKSNNLILTRQHGTQDGCPGDSGGPVLIDGEVVGIVSGGSPPKGKLCGGGKITLVNRYKGWIEENIGHKIESRESIDLLDVSKVESVRTAAARGWHVYCAKRKDASRYCAAEHIDENKPEIEFYLDTYYGFSIGYIAPTRQYETGPAKMHIGQQKMDALVKAVACDGVACLHVINPVNAPSDVLRALKSADKIRFWAGRSWDFSLAGSSAALTALLDAAKETSVPIPEDLTP